MFNVHFGGQVVVRGPKGVFTPNMFILHYTIFHPCALFIPVLKNYTRAHSVAITSEGVNKLS